jgi:hypothetical protein
MSAPKSERECRRDLARAGRRTALGAQFAVFVVVEPRFATLIAARHQSARLSPPHGLKCLMKRNDGHLRAG